MTTITILSAAAVAEAVVLAGLVTLVARMYSRLARVREVSTGAVTQMDELVREAQSLSAALADQLDEQIQLRESLADEAARAHAQVAALSRAVTEEPKPAATRKRTTAKAAAATVTEPTPARPRSRKAVEPEVEENSLSADVAAARQLGMDPLGVAIQRGLGKQRALLA